MIYSRRVVEIVDILSHQTDYMAVSEIAEQLNISKRTIFREMEDVERLTKAFGMILHKKTRLGLKLEASEQQKLKLNALLNQTTDDHFSQEERQRMLIIELLKSREPRKFYYFATQLGVSEATISYDMDKIESWFASREIKLIRKPGFGVYLEGNEGQFRKAIVDFLYQNYEHQDLIALLDSSNMQSELVETVIDQDILINVGVILKSYEHYLANRLTDGSYVGLMIHLAIAIQRIKRGESIFMNAEILEGLKKDAQFEIAKSIGDGVEETFGIKFPEDELGYITMHLKGSKLRTGAIIDQNDLILTNFEITRLASQMINEFKNLSGYDFNEDEKLLIGLVSHLKPAVTRMKLKLDIRNPLLDKIKEMYPEIYTMSEKTASMMSDQYEVTVPDEEIGYLAMHFGAAIERYRKTQHQDQKLRTGIVCSSGIGTSSLLYSRVSKLFANLELVGQFSKEDILLGKLASQEIDLLISTIHLDQLSYPCIKVNPLLPDEDVEKIIQVTNILKRQVKPFTETPLKIQSDRIKDLHGMTEAILNIEQNFSLETQIKIKNITELLKKIADVMTSDSKHKKILLKQLVEREKLGSTVIHGEGIILIHTKTEAVDTLKFSIWRFLNPIHTSRNEALHLAVIMCMPIGASKIQLALMSQVSKALIEEDAFLLAIKEGTEAQIEQRLKRILHKWLNRHLQGGADYDRS
ncbi:BglG family transcription antiterminator [Fusibacter ferrireducens]|uniref:BglG family transcription antiterminator n=1 Tax=Fusibacter ferrireducens TaxID=2785058 RepID=A0ABS0A084_9FIRM|nr:BglG family transcription antiterminator [Fusibacter ferrireducens]MBF4695284.1 BglG family transcription antiterminator [Fusibacter ferrireducens]